LNPAARTLGAFRKAGYRAGIVERWIAPAKKRIDLFGFIDGISINPKHQLHGIIAWQACTGGDLAAHLKKIQEECYDAACDWLRSGGLIEVWAWRKLSPRGVKRELWKPIIVGLELNEDVDRLVEAYRTDLEEWAGFEKNP